MQHMGKSKHEEETEKLLGSHTSLVVSMKDEHKKLLDEYEQERSKVLAEVESVVHEASSLAYNEVQQAEKEPTHQPPV